MRIALLTDLCTAAVVPALAGAGIARNVIAAAHHDHLFVPSMRPAPRWPH